MNPPYTHHIVTSFLKGEFEKAGVKAVFTMSDTPAGKSDLPDEEGLYCVEVVSEKNLLEAINRVHTIKLRNPHVQYGFIVLCPDELFASVEPFPNLLNIHFNVVLFSFTGTQSITGYNRTLPEIVALINTDEPAHNLSLEWVTTILRMAIASIAKTLPPTGGYLEKTFQQNHVFTTILYKKEYPLTALKMVSAYLLVNQLLFYNILSKKRQLPEIDTQSLTTPSQLRNYFDLVSYEPFQQVFAYDIVSTIPEDITHLKKVINVIKNIPELKNDVLGTLFHDIIPGTVRKSIAAFYTNQYAADLLAWLALDDDAARVADFAVGSGGLLVAAYNRKKILHTGEFSEKDHKQFINQLVGVDVMPFAAYTAACHIALQYPESDATANISVQDSTALHPFTTIPSIAAATPGENAIFLTKYDVILMNPPFTRQERVPSRLKSVLRDRFKEYTHYLHGQISYYSYFVLLADRFLKEGGRLALVLPAAFLRVRSSRSIVKFLAERYHIEYVLTGKKRLNFSESTWRREILLVARKCKTKRKDTIFCALSNLPKTKDECEHIKTTIKKVTKKYEDEYMSAICVPFVELERDYDWFRFITPFESELSVLWERIRTAKTLEKVEDIYDMKMIREGIESRKGMNIQAVFIVNAPKRMVRKEDAWIVDTVKEYITVKNRYTTAKLDIPTEAVVPCLRTMSHNPLMDIVHSDFVVVNDFSKADQFFYGERASLKPLLPVWNQYVKKRRGNVIMVRRCVITAPGTFHLCYYASQPLAAPGTAWVCTMTEEDAKIVCLWFNSSMHLAQVLLTRIEDIWIDIHKYILGDFLIINPHTLSKQQKKKLLTLFDTVKKEKGLPLVEQYTSIPESKKEIDTALLSVLGFNNNEIESLLSHLYAALKTEFSALASVTR